MDLLLSTLEVKMQQSKRLKAVGGLNSGEEGSMWNQVEPIKMSKLRPNSRCTVFALGLAPDASFAISTSADTKLVKYDLLARTVLRPIRRY